MSSRRPASGAGKQPAGAVRRSRISDTIEVDDDLGGGGVFASPAPLRPSAKSAVPPLANIRQAPTTSRGADSASASRTRGPNKNPLNSPNISASSGGAAPHRVGGPSSSQQGRGRGSGSGLGVSLLGDSDDDDTPPPPSRRHTSPQQPALTSTGDGNQQKEQKDQTNQWLEAWSTPLWGCSEHVKPLCCEVLACHPCNTSFQIAAAQDKQDSAQLNPIPCVGVIAFDLLACGAGSLIASLFVRRVIRTRFDIGEDLAPEVAISCLCAPCSLAQTDRELRIRGKTPHTAWVKPPTLQQAMAARPPRGRTGLAGSPVKSAQVEVAPSPQ